MTERNFIIATAGHVDHGKSALVRALTGTDPDRLPEEKARGITIDLGFAELNLTGPAGEDLHAGMIDVPGHESFVRNMIAGIGSIDLALLVVAADDGWMPQTEEHLQILFYLGVDRAVIALSKADLGDVEKVKSQLRNELSSTPFAQAPIVPTSTRTGAGIAQLKAALAFELSNIQPQHDTAKPRLFVDRAFTLHGIGTVVTGTLSGGMLLRGQAVTIHPRNGKARIRSIQNHGRDSDFALPGMRTAINLPDLAVGDSAGAIERGDVVCGHDPEPSSFIDVLLEKSSRLREKEPAARPLRSGASVFLHHGTSRVPAKVVLLEREIVKPGEREIAQLRLDFPIVAFAGDRFVIRDRSEQHTVAGGIVLDPDAARKNFRSPAQRKFLAARAAKPNDLDVWVTSEIERRGAARVPTLLLKSRFSADEISASLQRLHQKNEVVIRGQIAATRQSWEQLQNRAERLIDAAHTANSQRPGLDVNELRAALPELGPEILAALVSDLCRNGFVQKGPDIARASHRPELPSHLKAIAENVLMRLAEKPFDPPSRKELASNRDARQTLSFLIAQGDAVEIGPDALLSQQAFVDMKNAIAKFISANGPATVSQLRQELGTSRRIAVPLLELLDRSGFTRRNGDKRNLANRR